MPGNCVTSVIQISGNFSNSHSSINTMSAKSGILSMYRHLLMPHRTPPFLFPSLCKNAVFGKTVFLG